MDIIRYCDMCGRKLQVTNVTDGAGTDGYYVGCIPCNSRDSGGTLNSSTTPRAGNANTTVSRS